MALQRVKPGDAFRPSASTWNAFIDAANRVPKRGGANSQRVAPPAPIAAHGHVMIRNDSGADVPRFGILKLGDAIADPSSNLDGFKNQLLMEGLAPTAGKADGKFVVMQRAVANGRISPLGMLIGVTPVKINIADADQAYADMKDADSTQLDGSPLGPAQIMWKETGTGAGKWAIVKLGDVRIAALLGKTDAAHNKGSNGTISVYSGATKGSEGDTGINITAYNRFADVASGKWTHVSWIDSGWELSGGAEC